MTASEYFLSSYFSRTSASSSSPATTTTATTTAAASGGTTATATTATSIFSKRAPPMINRFIHSMSGGGQSSSISDSNNGNNNNNNNNNDDRNDDSSSAVGGGAPANNNGEDGGMMMNTTNGGICSKQDNNNSSNNNNSIMQSPLECQEPNAENTNNNNNNNGDKDHAATTTTNNNATTTTTTTSPSKNTNTPLTTPSPQTHPRALKILFLSSDTGGGHRASAQSLAQQFQLLFPGSTYALCDIIQLDGPPPYNTLVTMYKHLSQHPQQWKLVYNVSNTRAYEMVADVHMKSMMERSVRKRILGYEPDVVVSVHPLMTNVPVLACRNIGRESGRHLPIFTVCTDLGSAHSMWFANGVEKLFVASEMIRDLAMQRGKVPIEKIVMSGLPIRRDFAIQAEKMGNRHSIEGQVYRKYVRETLGLKQYGQRKTILVMGGGEGCGRLSHIVDSLYLQFVERGMEALILVVCGRNDTLKESLTNRDWEEMKRRYLMARNKGADYDTCVGVLSDVGCIDGGLGVANHLRRIISSPSLMGSGVGALTSVPSVNAFISPTSAAVHTYVDHHGQGYATSLPNSRSNSPGPNTAAGASSEEDIEVVTESFVKKQIDDIGEKDWKVGGDGAEKTPETIPVSNASSFTHEDGQTSNDVSGVHGVDSIDDDDDDDDDDEAFLCQDQVKVIGLGFITKMAEYMVAADVLVTKAGPGTIAEAAALSLPVMLTSFLPGQEEGNVDYVVDGGFGSFISDADPHGISEEVASWLLDERKLRELSENAFKRGAPDAAAEIVEAIGESALRWKKSNEEGHREGEVVEDEDCGVEASVDEVSSK